MRSAQLKFFACIAIASVSVQVSAQNVAPFKQGDRVVFAGNSITEAGYYESYIWLYYMTHFPERRFEIFNAGIGGNRAIDIYNRLDADVLNNKPTVIALDFGMNDSGFFEWNQPDKAAQATKNIARSLKEYQAIEKRFLALPDVKKIILTPSLYDETVKNPKNYWPGKAAAIDSISKFQLASAKNNNWGAVDFFHEMTDITLREQKKNPEFTITGPDRVHPGPQGHFVMAYIFLKAQGLAGKPVADVAIDAKTKKVIKSVNATISKVTATLNSLSFDYLANSLPYPIDTVPRIWENPYKQSDVLPFIPWTKEFNTEQLTIKNLQGKNYRLKIDGNIIGTWTAQQFAQGINLGQLQNTPQYMQAEDVRRLNQQRIEVEGRLREYYWIQFNYLQKHNMLFDDSEAVRDSVEAQAKKDWGVAAKKDSYMKARVKETRDAWVKEMNGYVNKIYTINKPVKHKIEVLLIP
ncbi:MAG: GDSL family lipase [Sphingobacteriaceae bacterium]|nr:MAG: GDSL family lipase [Sphingobacteriaceae bacterium]